MVSGSEPGTSKSVSISSDYCHVLIYPPRLPAPRLVMVSTRVLNGWLQTLSAGHSGFICGLGSALALLHLTIFHDVEKLHSAVNVAQLPLVPFKLTSFLTSFSFLIALWACNRSSCRTWSCNAPTSSVLLPFCINPPQRLYKMLSFFLCKSYSNHRMTDLLHQRPSPGNSLPTASASFLRRSPVSLLGASRHDVPYFASLSSKACSRLYFTMP